MLIVALGLLFITLDSPWIAGLVIGFGILAVAFTVIDDIVNEENPNT